MLALALHATWSPRQRRAARAPRGAPAAASASWARVEEAMTRDVLTLRPETPLRDALRVMLTHHVHAAPVVDASGGVLGVLSQTDLLSLSAGAISAAADLARLQYSGGEPRDAPPLSLATSTVGAALPPLAPLVAVAPGAPLPEAAALMLHHGIHTLPVVDAPPAAATTVPQRGSAAAAEAASAKRAGTGTSPPPKPPRLLGVLSRVDVLRAVLAAAEADAAAAQRARDAA